MVTTLPEAVLLGWVEEDEVAPVIAWEELAVEDPLAWDEPEVEDPEACDELAVEAPAACDVLAVEAEDQEVGLELAETDLPATEAELWLEMEE